MLFPFLPRRFTSRQLRELFADTVLAWGTGQATYDKRRLRLRGLIERVPRTHRWRVTGKGQRIAL